MCIDDGTTVEINRAILYCHVGSRPERPHFKEVQPFKIALEGRFIVVIIRGHSNELERLPELDTFEIKTLRWSS